MINRRSRCHDIGTRRYARYAHISMLIAVLDHFRCRRLRHHSMLFACRFTRVAASAARVCPRRLRRYVSVKARHVKRAAQRAGLMVSARRVRDGAAARRRIQRVAVVQMPLTLIHRARAGCGRYQRTYVTTTRRCASHYLRPDARVLRDVYSGYYECFHDIELTTDDMLRQRDGAIRADAAMERARTICCYAAACCARVRARLRALSLYRARVL